MSIDRSKQRRKPHGYSESEIWDMIEQVAIKHYGATGNFPRSYATGGKGVQFDIKPDKGPITRGKNKGRCTVYANYNSQTGEYDVAGRLMCYSNSEIKVSVEELCKHCNNPFPKDGLIKKFTAEELAERNRLQEIEDQKKAKEAHLAFRKTALEHTIGALVAQLEYSRAKQHSVDLQNPVYRSEVQQKVKFVNAHPYPIKKEMNNPEKALIIHPKEPNLREIKDFVENKFAPPNLPDEMKGGFFKFSSREILDAMKDYDKYILPRNRTDGVMILPVDHATDNITINMQMILTKPTPSGKDKFFIGGALKKTGCLIFNEESLSQDTKHIFITEGYATGESLRLSMNDPSKPIVVGWDKDNIGVVTTLLANKFPNANFIFASDNDFKNFYTATEKFNKNESQLVENGGLKSVIEYTASAPDSIRQRLGILLPRIDYTNPNNIKMTDFNDIHLRDGLQASRSILVNEMKELVERRKTNVCEATYWKDHYNQQVNFFRESMNEPRLKTLDIDILKVNEPKPYVAPEKQSIAENNKVAAQEKVAEVNSAPTPSQPKVVAPVVEMPANSPINLRECNNALDMIKGITDEHLQKIKPKSILESGVIEDCPKTEPKKARYGNYQRNESAKTEAPKELSVSSPKQSVAEPEKTAPVNSAPKAPAAEEPKAPSKSAPNADEPVTANNVYVNTTTVVNSDAPANQPLIDPAVMTKLLVRSIEMQRAIGTIESLRECELPLHDKEEVYSIAAGTTYTKAQDLVMAALDPVMGPHIKEKLKETLENSRNLPVFEELNNVDNFLTSHTTVLAKEELDAVKLNQNILASVVGNIENRDSAIEGINEAIIGTSSLRFDRSEKGIMYRSIIENFASIKDDSGWVKEVIQEFNKVKSALDGANKQNSVQASSEYSQRNEKAATNQPSI